MDVCAELLLISPQLLFMSAECAALFDIVPVITELRSLQADCGWLMLVEGWHKLRDHDLANAAELLDRGTCIVTVIVINVTLMQKCSALCGLRGIMCP